MEKVPSEVKKNITFEHENVAQFASTLGHALRSNLCLVNGFVEDCVSGAEVSKEDAEFADKALKNIFSHLNQISKYQHFCREEFLIDGQKMVESLRSFSQEFFFAGPLSVRVSSLVVPIVAGLFFYFDGHLKGEVEKRLEIKETGKAFEFQVVGTSSGVVEKGKLEIKSLSSLIETDKTWFGATLICVRSFLGEIGTSEVQLELTNTQIKTTFFIQKHKPSF